MDSDSSINNFTLLDESLTVSPILSEKLVINNTRPEEILMDLLKETGRVSITKFKSKLRANNHSNVDEIVEEFSSETSRWKKKERSFCTLKKFAELEKEQENEGPPDNLEDTSSSGHDTDGAEGYSEPQSTERKVRVGNERRLCDQYILPFLRSLYYSDSNKNDYEVAFNVQDQRPSTQFRNVDLIAVNWRDEETAELVTVEAKNEFNAQVVQQAANYSRFSHRVWIAVVVDSSLEVEEIVSSLREKDSLLFEYVLSLGLGIIACQPARGRSFDCYPVQWPQRQEPDHFEKQVFLEDYRETFEKAGLLQATKKVGRVA